MEHLLQHIQRFVELNNEEQEAIASCFRYEEVPKKGYLLKMGKISVGRYFVQKGLLRQCILGEHEEEQITAFALEGWWMADYDSLDRQQPSKYFIQAVEPTEVWVLDRDMEEELFTRVPKMERYFRLVLQRSHSAANMRIKYIFTTSGEERYLFFARMFPEFIQRIPQYMLANYLGFSAEFLSKIRAKKL